MMYKKICEECGKEFVTKYYQQKICSENHYRKCIVCGKEFLVDRKDYNKSKDNRKKTCSRKCSTILAKQTSIANNGTDFNNTKKAKQTRLNKYGAYESNDIKTKRQQTVQEKYNRNCSIDINKAKKTKLRKYNNENFNNRNQYKKTCLKIYGVDNASKSDIIKQKIVMTNINNWGVDYTFKTDNNKIKSKETKLKRYGDATYTNSEKAMQTKLKKYGANMSTKAIEQMRSTKKTLYGYTSWNMNKSVKTNLERYGVPYYCMTDECRKLAHTPISQNNLRLKEQLENLGYEVKLEFAIQKLQYDLKINNILIEIDPTYTHNSTVGPKFSEDSFGKPKDRYYHQNKSKIAEENGYRCIHIFDWDNKEKIINMLKPKQDIYARKCTIKEVNLEECANFLNTYHLQNNCKGQKVRLGLYYNNELIQIMTFGKPRYNKKYEWELLRLCTQAEYKIIGGANKLFSYFIREYQSHSIISYCDMSKFNGEVYEKLGFELLNISGPSLHWSKYNLHITNNLLNQRGFDQLFGTNYGKGTSNKDLMIQNGWKEVYDCGQASYIWNL